MHREKDAALQTALDELTRLGSFTGAGLNYSEYSDRLLTGKGNIDVALQRTTDEAAKAKIDLAVSYYVAARKAWGLSLEYKNSDIGPQEDWAEASHLSHVAAEYAFADDAERQEIEAEETKRLDHKLTLRKEAENARQAAEKAREDAEKARVAREEQAESEWRKAEAETLRRKAAEAAEREKLRRFAPAGTVFNVKAISVAMSDGIMTIPPGTQLSVTKTNADGTLHVEGAGGAADVLAADVTNDRDLADAVRANDSNSQAAVKQWRIQQAEAAARLEAQKHIQSPSPPPDGTSSLESLPVYVSPLDRRPK